MNFRKSLSWLGVSQAVALVMQFASSVVFARYLTPYEMGIFAVALAIVGILALFQQISLPALIVREENLTEDFTRTAFTVNAVLTVLLSLVIVGASYLGAAAMKDAGVRDVLLVLAITPLFGVVTFLPTAQMEREGRFKRLALISIGSGIIGSVTGIVLVVAGFGYISIAYAQVTGTAAFAVAALIAGRHHARYRLGLNSWRRIFGFSVQILAVSGIHSGASRATDLLIGRLLGLGALGIYTRASGLNNLVWGNIASLVGRIVLVDFAQLHRQGAPLRERYIWTAAVMTAVLWPAFAGLAVVAKPFIVLVYGEKWLPAVAPLTLLALSSILLTAVTMTWELFTATGRLRDQTRIEFVRVLVGTAFFALGCLISLEAAAAARVLDAVFAIWIYRPYLNEMTGTAWRDFRRNYLQAALGTLLAVAPAGALMVASGDGLPPVPALVGAILLGVALWAGGLVMMKHPLSFEIKRAASLVLRRSPPSQAGAA